MSWKEVPMPANIKRLEKDKRGMPVPVIVLRDKFDKPHFQINDAARVKECLENRLCSICGQPLGDDMWLSGGPLSAFHPNGGYIDSPTHHDCGYYALQVCPYLSNDRYNNRIDGATLTTDNFEGLAFVDLNMIPERPPFFAYVKVADFEIQDQTNYIIPKRPYLAVELWNNGRMITTEEAVRLYNLKI
jgi:hypothetical protein